VLESARLGESPFAVVDVETTGLYFNTDRVIEVAVVRIRPDGSIEDEYETLVNPGRDVGPSEIHRITATDVAHAPAFAEIATDVASRIHGAVVVGHNLRFDLSFLRSEFTRIDVNVPELPTLCTLRLAHRFLPIPTRKLSDCCAELGIAHEAAHSALGDAHATSELLKALIQAALDEGVRDLGELGCDPLSFPPAWLKGRAPGVRCTRGDAVRIASEERAFLPRLVSKLAGDEATNADEAEYMAILDHALEDRRVTAAEGRGLLELAARIGLSRADVERAHDSYVGALVTAAWADGDVTDTELRDLLLVGEMLGVTRDRVIQLIEHRPKVRPAEVRREDLRDKTVCFTGSLAEYSLNGEPLTRSLAESLASRAGLVPLPSVMKKLDILVVSDSSTLSSKARKAREYGTRIIAAAAFFAAIGVNLK
jgi:DNA polymerase III subunit epsilon